MNTSTPLLRARHAALALLGRRGEWYSPSEVVRLLRPGTRPPDERRRAVLDAAAMPGAWLGYLGRRDALRIGRFAERLPTIVFLHASGASPEQIAQRFGGWGGWEAEQALEAAAACIATRLNDRGVPTAGRAA
jgi:hypothetical protein